jgi:hypothetical protein
MKLKYYSFLVITIVLVSKQSFAKESLIKAPFTNSSESLAQIEKVIFDKYIGGQISGDASLIKDSFSKDAVMLTPALPSSAASSLTRWLDMHSEADMWGASPNTNLNINEIKILKLDIIDDRLATAQIKMEERVYEIVTLVKIDNHWKIASKVFIPQR